MLTSSFVTSLDLYTSVFKRERREGGKGWLEQGKAMMVYSSLAAQLHSPLFVYEGIKCSIREQ